MTKEHYTVLLIAVSVEEHAMLHRSLSGDPEKRFCVVSAENLSSAKCHFRQRPGPDCVVMSFDPARETIGTLRHGLGTAATAFVLLTGASAFPAALDASKNDVDEILIRENLFPAYLQYAITSAGCP